MRRNVANPPTSANSKTFNGCTIALIVGVVAAILLPIIGIVVIRMFGHAVEQVPAQVISDTTSQKKELPLP